MELANSTAVPVGLRVGTLGASNRRAGELFAKATFRVKNGRAVLDTQQPMPLLYADQETELGLLPRDDLVRGDDRFEVLLLGAAHAPGGRPVAATKVRLRVGDIVHEMAVFGDRWWKGGALGPTITSPRPFESMPLTWSRAYGGTVPVLIDEESWVDVSAPENPYGLGFDPAPQARGLARQLGTRRPYPVWEDTRPLPNLEDPARLIGRPVDAPEPVCWAAAPLDVAPYARRQLVARGADVDEAFLLEEERFHYRAHPDWVIARPQPGARIVLENAMPEGKLELDLPELRVVCDYLNDGRTAAFELTPQVLMLLPEQRTVTLTYRRRFTFPHVRGAEKALRIRLEDGWMSG